MVVLRPTSQFMGGILGRRGIDDAIMNEYGIGSLDIVVVNLCPFANTVAKRYGVVMS